MRQNIQAFERDYVVVKPRKYTKERFYEGFMGLDPAALKKKFFDMYSFNLLESSKIGLERKIPDNRPQKCFTLQYPVILPSASVIIIFHNEAWSTLLRTIHSVLSRSPPAFLRQIILVDDCSDIDDGFGHLGSKLDKYLETLPKIHLLRSPRREGIVAARMRGASLSRGDVLVFLDSHCEVNKGWLEPMLARIAEDKTHVVTPDIEVIDFETFKYAERHDPSIGVFNWEMLFKWRKMDAFEKLTEIQGLPLRSPTMAGGLFAVSKTFFYDLGTYDTKMSYWGSENLELSFRIWMCGGTIEIMPCSKVGHVFRDTMPYKTGPGTAERNIKRLVEVWLDDYKSFVYSMKSQHFRDMDVGDLTERHELRKRLQCKSFSWYLQNVIPDLRIPDMNPLGRGEVMNEFNGMCIDTIGNNAVGGKMGLYSCHGMGGNQFFIYGKGMGLWHNDFCMGVSKPETGTKVVLFKCRTEDVLQKWEHTRNEFIRLSGHNLCMEPTVERGIVLQPCTNSVEQKWTFSSYPYYENTQSRH
ncbi:polypeptide N-acetylgalactosaminyltransferase 1-like [Dendronephthya gigantea]|uniref:polypeptide N-acetylgalactosaminyltransferase 1-like n=1 Tax=Dendronephthya gigantea TaxID=151771 RepID=UPI00106A6BB7|nr:polypeptide N-acetylgalactosaminyltransferase 1-like [Dendronephthya gigantea]